MKNRANIGVVFKWIFLILLALAILVPMVWIILGSFKSKVEIISYPPHFFINKVTIKNYQDLFKRIPVFLYLRNSMIYVVLLTASQLVVDSMAGYAFARMEFKGKHILFTLVLMGMMIPFQIIMIPLFIECSLLGLVNTYTGLVLPRIVSVTSIFMMRSYFTTLPQSLEEAGRIDGLNEFGIFLRIMVPLCVPIIITHAVLTFNMAWNDLLWPLLMTSSKTHRMLSNGLTAFVGADTTEYGPAFAGAVISIIPVLVLYLSGQKYFINSFVSSGMKE
jgi:multiple sugar transport system permease protein